MTEAADCLFCKIVRGEIPSDVVTDNDACLAFRDINPQAPTHVVVVPKQHHPDMAALANTDPGLTGRLLATMADGSVHFVSQTIDETIYRGMATRAGGEVVMLP